jgi:general secretion pathway protein A
MDFLSFWKLKEKPFENTGDPKFFYYSPNHKEAMVRLVYVIKNNKAGGLLAGDYGTGKTTIAHELLSEIEESNRYKSVYISNPLLTAKELVQEIADQIGVTGNESSRQKQRRLIEEKLERIAAEDKHTIIIVDEAHLLSKKEVLEELRLFMNLQSKNKFLATIVMMGQLELREVINAMPQFKQRFAICYVLKHLDEMETGRYIQHRLTIAGAERSIFSDSAKSLIYNASSGRPRQINNICDMSLLVGSMRGVEMIEPEIVREVIRDLDEEGI